MLTKLWDSSGLLPPFRFVSILTFLLTLLSTFLSMRISRKQFLEKTFTNVTDQILQHDH